MNAFVSEDAKNELTDMPKWTTPFKFDLDQFKSRFRLICKTTQIVSQIRKNHNDNHLNVHIKTWQSNLIGRFTLEKKIVQSCKWIKD